MNLDLTDEEAAALLKELNGIIDGDRYFLSDRIRTLKAIRAEIRPEPAREPLPPPPKRYAPPRATAASRMRSNFVAARLDETENRSTTRESGECSFYRLVSS